MFLFVSPCLFTAHSAINRSHSAEDFLSVRVALWQQLPFDRGERMACQGQSCALISVHHWTARLTPVPFTPEAEASWHYMCVCVLCFPSCLPLPFLFHGRGQPSETAYTIHTSSIMPQTWLRWSSHMWQADRGKKEGDRGGWRWQWALVSHWALCACYSMRSHRQERAKEREGESENERTLPWCP